MFFPWGSKGSLAKAAGAEVAVPQINEKWHAAVARSAFSSQNAQNTTIAEQFSKFTCPKMVRHCGAKRIFKSKCRKHHNRGAIFEVHMSKNGTPLWREAHFQVKMHKTLESRGNFGRSDPTKWYGAVARTIFSSQNAKKLTVRGIFRASDVQKWHAAVRKAHL